MFYSLLFPLREGWICFVALRSGWKNSTYDSRFTTALHNSIFDKSRTLTRLTGSIKMMRERDIPPLDPILDCNTCPREQKKSALRRRSHYAVTFHWDFFALRTLPILSCGMRVRLLRAAR
jgi:hypothetical protein